MLLGGAQAGRKVHGRLLRAGRGSQVELVLIHAQIHAIQRHFPHGGPNLQRQVFKHAIPLAGRADGEICRQCDIKDVRIGHHGDGGREGVGDVDDVGHALPDLTGETDGADDARSG